MEEHTGGADNLSGLRDEVRPAVGMLLERARADLGDDLLSLCVVGSALTGDFDTKRSDINTVMVVRRRSHALLQTLAAYGKTMGKKRLRAPLLMTDEYIRQSLDVFGVEFLDLQHNHFVVCGVDPFADLAFSKADVRLQCERELKGALIKLRQGYISTMGKPALVGGLLADCVGGLTAILRALLWLVDVERPREAMATVDVAAGALEFEASRLSITVGLRRDRPAPSAGQVEGLFEDVYQVVDHLSRKVDQIGEPR